MSKRIAVAGCGYWGKNIVRNMAEAGVLAAVCDHDPELAAKIGAQYKVPALSWDAMLADVSIQGVAIAAPAALHFKLAKAAIEAGKDVFVEKPLSLNIAEARQLCELADSRKKILMVGHLLQYHPAFLKLREIVAAGTLGRLNYIYSNRLNLGKIRREEDILWSFAPHDISMILGLAGQEPGSVSAVGSYHLHDSIADVTTTHLSFPNGLRAHIFVSWLHPFKEQKLVVVGDRGMAVFDDSQDWAGKLVVYNHTISWQEGMPVPSKAEATPVALDVSEPLRNECEHFAACIASRERPRTDGWEGLRVLTVLAAASDDLKRRQGSIPEQRTAKSEKPSFPGVTIHESAYVDAPAQIGAGTKIWHFSHVLPHTVIGKDCVIGQNVTIGPDVRVGDKCKIQNNVSLYKGVTLEDGVFCGPSCVFTNVNNPRAEINRKDEFRETLVRRGTTIGANATIVCGHELGEYSFIAAGAVVAGDVPAFALMAGVPAKRIGWMSHAGVKLGRDLVCPQEGRRYREKNGTLEEITASLKEVANG